MVPLLGLAWMAGVGLSLQFAERDLRAGDIAIREGRDSLLGADLGPATDAFERAEERARSGLRHLRAPHVRAAAAVPVVGDSFVAADALAVSITEIAGAVHQLTIATEALPEGVETLRPVEGTLPIEAVQQLAPHIDDLSAALGRAVERVELARTDYVVDAIAREQERFLAMASPIAEGAGVAAALTAELPAFLGDHEPKRYVYAAANPAEPRGTGGYLGAYSVIDVERGSFEIGPFTAAYDLTTVPARNLVSPSAAFAQRYNPFGGAGFWQNINMTPDFPTAAAAIVTLWNEVHDDTVDGVISVDPFALEAFLEAAGPITIQGRTVAAENVVTYVTNEAYEELGTGSERQEIIGEVAAAALEAYLQAPDLDALTQTLDPLKRLATGGHLLLYSTDPDTQRAFRRAGIDGGLPDDIGDPFGVVINDGSATKLDFYAQRKLDYEVRLLRHGRASSHLKVTIGNDAPTEGRSRHIIGPNVPGLEPGEMRLLTSVYCSPTCQFSEDPRGGERTATSREAGFVFVDSWVRIPSSEQVELEYAWTTAEAWEDHDGAVVYRLVYDDQVTIRPTEISVRIHVPTGFEPVELPEGSKLEGGVVIWERDEDRGDVELLLRFRPSIGDQD